MQKLLKRVTILAFGWVLVLGGVVGVFLPIVPGWFLLVIGVLMLNSECAWLRQAVNKCRARFPALDRFLKPISAQDER